jgi:hypothetical protein
MSSLAPAGGSSEDRGAVEVTELRVAASRWVDAEEAAMKRKATLFEQFSLPSLEATVESSDSVESRSEGDAV